MYITLVPRLTRWVVNPIFVFQRLWPSLNYGFKSYLGPKYTKEVSEAWRKVYMYICLQMRRGMECTQRDVELTS